MKTLGTLVLLTALAGCEKGSTEGAPPSGASASKPAAAAPAAENKPTPRRTGQNTVVDVAIGSKDHTTLVAALTAADYVESLDNAGPFTVFAPTNAAFDKLPKGTVEGLVKPEKQNDLRNILKYHVTVSMYQQKALTDGMVLAMANGAKATVHVKDGKVKINDSTIIATVQASNGIVHVVDTVLLPPAAPLSSASRCVSASSRSCRRPFGPRPDLRQRLALRLAPPGFDCWHDGFSPRQPARAGGA